MNRALIITFLSISYIHAYAQFNNGLELDFGGAYVVFAPKHHLPGDQYNPVLNHIAGMWGLYYERCLPSGRFAIKGGAALAQQHEGVGVLHCPLQFNGTLVGKRQFSRINIGYTGGLGFNSILFYTLPISVLPRGGDFDLSFKRRFYVAPHVGINAAVNFGRIAITADYMFHFLIPEYINFRIEYLDTAGNKIVENNTNKSIGMTFKLGMLIRFGRKKIDTI